MPALIPTTNQEPTIIPKGEVCEECSEPISEKMAKFTRKRFGKALCLDCQRKVRIKENPRLGRFISNQVERKYANVEN